MNELIEAGGSDGKESVQSVGKTDSIPRSEKSPGEGNCYPLQYFFLENTMDKGAWWATVHWMQRFGHN